MNPMPEPLTRGTFGELLVQIRLLQHSVQAAPPSKDTGNDLIAVCGEEFRAVQVKTTASQRARLPKAKLSKSKWHVLAIVRLVAYTFKPNLRHIDVELDKAEIYLLDRKELTKYSFNWDELQKYKLDCDRVVRLFWDAGSRIARQPTAAF